MEVKMLLNEWEKEKLSKLFMTDLSSQKYLIDFKADFDKHDFENNKGALLANYVKTTELRKKLLGD